MMSFQFPYSNKVKIIYIWRYDELVEDVTQFYTSLLNLVHGSRALVSIEGLTRFGEFVP